MYAPVYKNTHLKVLIKKLRTMNVKTKILTVEAESIKKNTAGNGGTFI